MKSLILIRHAKSSWQFNLEDKKRPLTESGVQAIKKVSQLADGLVSDPFSIWSSTAVRAKNTALLFCEALGFDVNTIVFKDDLYTFNEVALEKQIKNCDNRINKLILFGHNEAITNFVNKFGDEYVFNVPTAGLVVLQFEEKEWAAIKNGKIIKTIFPKEI